MPTDELHADQTLPADLHEPFHYRQSTDPGSVGASKYWLDTTDPAQFVLKRRNAANTAWVTVGSTGGNTAADISYDPSIAGMLFADDVQEAIDELLNVWIAPLSNVSLLDGNYHGDTVAQVVSRGSIIIGNSTPKWTELTIGSANAFLRSSGTDISWSTGLLAITAAKTLTVTNSLTIGGTDGKSLTLTGSLTIGADTTINGGGTLTLPITSPNSALLDGSIHTDTVAQAVTRGSLIVGNLTPKWDELVLGGANSFIRSDGTDVLWSTGFLAVTAAKTVTHTATITFAGTDGKTLTVSNSLTLSGTDAKILTLTGSLTIGADTTITGGGTVALGGFTLTVPATGTTALLGVVNTFTRRTNITGSADEVQFRIMAFSGQTAPIMEWRNSSNVLIGVLYNAGGFGVGAGHSTVSNAVAIGINALATDVGACAVGQLTQATFSAATAVGYNCKAQQDGSTAVGVACLAQGVSSSSMGYNCRTSFGGGVTMGRGAIVTTASCGSIGYFHEDIGGFNTIASTLMIGCGDNTGSTRNIWLYKTVTIFNDDGEDVDLRIEGDTDVNLGFFDAGNDRFGIGTATPATKVHAILNDATTNAITNVLTIGHNSTGTPAAGFGAGLALQLESSTTIDQNAGLLTAEWVVATHASRTARLTFSVYDTAVREAIRIEASGTAAMIGFWGTAAAVKQTLAAYTTDAESGAYTGIDNAQVGTPYAQLTDLNTLRVAYENLRASYDDLRTKLQATTLVA